VSSGVDYCNAIFIGAPKNVTDKLQRVLNVAACIVSGTIIIIVIILHVSGLDECSVRNVSQLLKLSTLGLGSWQMEYHDG